MREKNELVLSEDINVITAEIKVDLQGISNGMLRVGERLAYVRENKMAEQKGGWNKWCDEELGISRKHANRFIRVFDRFGTGTLESRMSSSVTVLDALVDFSDEDLEKPREMPNGEIKTLLEMSRREIEEFKNKLKEKEEHEKLLEEENSKLSQEKDKLSSQLQQERNKTQQVETKLVEKEVYIEVDKTDYTKLQQLQRDADSYKRKFESAERMKELLETRLQQEESDADAHRKLKDEIKSLQSQKGDMYRQMESAKILGEFQAKVESFLLDELAPKVYSKFKDEIGESRSLSESFIETLDKIDEWLRDMRYAVSSGTTVKNMGKIIEAEVVEYE